jgi:tetratricopeptide (TPR) repeat protein
MQVGSWFALLLALLFTGCGSSPAPSPAKGPESPSTPNNTGSKPSATAGTITITTGIPAKSIAEYTEAIEKNPNEVNSRGELAYQLRGAAFMKQGDHDKAIADFTEAIRLYRERKTLYYQIRLLEVFDARAQSFRKKDDTLFAIIDYGEIIKFGSHFTSGDMMEVLAVQGFTTQAYIDRAQCYDELKQADKATADYKEALRMQPSLMTDELRKRLEPGPARANDTPKEDVKVDK